MSEEYEYVPWSQLANQQRTQRNRTMYIAAGVIAAIAIGALVARSALGSASVQPQPTAQATPDTTTAELTTTTTDASPSLYSEADLMALIEGEATRAVATRAEWFVRDYFTSDDDPRWPSDIAAALAQDVPLPALPPSTSPAYVEWAKAYEVIETMPGLFRATVVFRTIGGQPYERLPVQAVEVGVAIQGDGGTTIIELPNPVPIPGTEE